MLLKACNTTEPPPDGEKPTLKLKLEDVSCTEAWIELRTTNLKLPATLTLKQNDQPRETINLNKADTILYLDSLLPNTTYIFHTTIQSSNQSEVKSNEISVTTMDTTSHNFTFTSWTFGTIGSSTLYDVAIINENNIWAVGEIMIADTSQNGYTTYNAVHWDGSQWELLRIPHYDYPNTLVYEELQTIFAFSENDIWFCSYSNLVHYDGNTFSSKAQFMTSVNFNGQVMKMWGSDRNNIYCVGRNGAIYHYYGTGWRRIESGTELQFTDIYGATNTKTSEQEILAVCTRNLPLDKGIYRIQGNTAVEISSVPIQWELFALWFVPNRHYYVVGSGIYEKKSLADSLWLNEPLDITRYGTSGIRGNSINDVFVSGAFGEFLHFNGVTWKSYINETGWFSGSYGAVAVKNNLVVTVGYEGAQAKIMVGKRTN
ncbi:MAG: hypothetical protein BroJett005_01630 [Ignavibacteriota bacterium]|nr:MAG: hypothetical protein BroJett005_01630 [Ignavibacteriota bacterium]